MRDEAGSKDGVEPLMTADEVATYLRVTAGSVYNWVSKGEIPFVKVGAAVRFRRTELDRWVEERAGRVPAEEPTA